MAPPTTYRQLIDYHINTLCHLLCELGRYGRQSGSVGFFPISDLRHPFGTGPHLFVNMRRLTKSGSSFFPLITRSVIRRVVIDR